MLKQMEKTFKALGDKNRLRIINMLRDRPMCVCEITDVLSVSQSTVSGHLRVLKEAGLIEDSKDGLWVEYHLSPNEKIIKSLLQIIADAGDRDMNLEKERRLARRTDRKVLCRK
jgi:ArsR family transcriptional regulator